MSLGYQLISSLEQIKSLQKENADLTELLSLADKEASSLLEVIESLKSKISRMESAFNIVGHNVGFVTRTCVGHKVYDCPDAPEADHSTALYLVGDSGLDEEDFEYLPEDKWKEGWSVYCEGGFKGVHKWIEGVDNWVPLASHAPELLRNVSKNNQSLRA